MYTIYVLITPFWAVIIQKAVEGEIERQCFLDKLIEVAVVLKHTEDMQTLNTTGKGETSSQLLENSVPLIKCFPKCMRRNIKF